MATLTMARGDDRTIIFTFDADTEFEDGDTVWLTVKRSAGDPDSAAVVQAASPDDVTLTATTAAAAIPASATSGLLYLARLVYDWQIRTAAGLVHTLDTGVLIVSPDVTRTATP